MKARDELYECEKLEVSILIEESSAHLLECFELEVFDVDSFEASR